MIGPLAQLAAATRKVAEGDFRPVKDYSRRGELGVLTRSFNEMTRQLQEAKKAHEAKLKQKQVQVKEVKLRPGTDENDYQIKLRNLIKFLNEGDKAKVTLSFRGREMAHQEFGMRQLERVKADLEEIGQVEQMPKMEGRQMIMVIAPKKKH